MFSFSCLVVQSVLLTIISVIFALFDSKPNYVFIVTVVTAAISSPIVAAGCLVAKRGSRSVIININNDTDMYYRVVNYILQKHKHNIRKTILVGKTLIPTSCYICNPRIQCKDGRGTILIKVLENKNNIPDIAIYADNIRFIEAFIDQLSK